MRAMLALTPVIVCLLAPSSEANDDCVNDDSTTDKWGDTCTSFYEIHPDACGKADTDTFTASVQCCVCKALQTGRECTDINVGQEWQSEDGSSKCICRNDGAIGCTDASTGLLVLGGAYGPNNFSTVEYVPLTSGGPDSCAPEVPALPTTVVGPSVVTTEGRVLTCGLTWPIDQSSAGHRWRKDNIASSDCYSWTWRTEDWTPAPSLPTVKKYCQKKIDEDEEVGEDYDAGTSNSPLANKCKEACQLNENCRNVDIRDTHCELLIEGEGRIAIRPVGLEGGQMVVVGERILWIGGKESCPDGHDLAPLDQGPHGSPDKVYATDKTATQEWTQMGTLKETRMYHCSVTYRDTVITSGGLKGMAEGKSTVEQFSLSDNQAFELPTMTQTRWQHSCTIFTHNKNGEYPSIIVAGGFGGRSDDPSAKTVESMAKTQVGWANWKRISELPMSKRGHVMVNHLGSLYILGGERNSYTDFSDEIQMSVDGGASWTISTTKLAIGRDQPAAVSTISLCQ